MIDKPKESEPPDFDKIVEAIRKTGDIATRMKRSGLSQEAIVILLQAATGIGKPAIRGVLEALPKLPNWCLVKPSVKAKP